MSAVSRKRLTLAVLLIFTVAWALSLPWVAKKLAWLGGRSGVCPLRLVSLIALFYCVIAVAIGTAVAVVSFKLTRKSGFIVGAIFWVLLTSWSLISVQQAVSGGLIKEYCRGFSETVQSHVDVAGLYDFFSMVLRDAEDHEWPYRVDPQSPFTRVVPGSRPSVAVYGHRGSTDRRVVVLWSCRGFGFGLVYGRAPPSKRGWLDDSIILADRIWVMAKISE